MPSRGQAVTLQYVAWNTSANAGQTGDSANHTLRLVKDGTSAAPTNAPAEVDSANAPGVYKLALTSAEATFDCVTLCGKSSTANVSVIPITVTFEQLPTATPGAANGLPTLDGSVHNNVNVTLVNGSAATTYTSAQLANTFWADNTAGDFTTAGSPGKILVGQLGSTIDASGRVQVQSGTGTGQISLTSGKAAVTVAAGDGVDAAATLAICQLYAGQLPPGVVAASPAPTTSAVTVVFASSVTTGSVLTGNPITFASYGGEIGGTVTGATGSGTTWALTFSNALNYAPTAGDKAVLRGAP